MPERKVYHVVPNPNGGWDVRREGSNRASAHLDTKDPAVDRATDLAKSAPLGQVIIHKGDGTIQTEHTYGEDPRRHKG